ncbi:hypothetical protein T484DRAFT_1815838 [Baffinella frigidus]|nr:hypothetical protein T484DRAFT_1815838 [Cryptophyta sp. CCMP2293]
MLERENALERKVHESAIFSTVYIDSRFMVDAIKGPISHDGLINHDVSALLTYFTSRDGRPDKHRFPHTSSGLINHDVSALLTYFTSRDGRPDKHRQSVGCKYLAGDCLWRYDVSALLTYFTSRDGRSDKHRAYLVSKMFSTGRVPEALLPFLWSAPGLPSEEEQTKRLLALLGAFDVIYPAGDGSGSRAWIAPCLASSILTTHH